MKFDIVDFHTHPFLNDSQNICNYISHCDMGVEQTRVMMERMGVVKICGSVLIRTNEVNPDWSPWDKLAAENAAALELRARYGSFYEPGFHVHPDYVRESCETIEKMHAAGFRLIGELVPYMDHWQDYSCKGFDEILDTARQYDMLVSFHAMGEDEMDRMVQRHPDVTLIAAHPGEAGAYARHLQRMAWSERYYLDLSGYGLFRHGMLRYGIDRFGAERFLFGSDFPTCNPAMYVGGVLLDDLISDAEKELIFSKNALRLLAR